MIRNYIHESKIPVIKSLELKKHKYMNFTIQNPWIHKSKSPKIHEANSMYSTIFFENPLKSPRYLDKCAPKYLKLRNCHIWLDFFSRDGQESWVHLSKRCRESVLPGVRVEHTWSDHFSLSTFFNRTQHSCCCWPFTETETECAGKLERNSHA